MTNDMKDNLSKCDDQPVHLKTTLDDNVGDGSDDLNLINQDDTNPLGDVTGFESVISHPRKMGNV